MPLYFQNCKQLEAGETTPLLKTADMNQNESAKGDRDKGLPSVKGESYYIYIYIIIFGHAILFSFTIQNICIISVLCMAMSV